MEKKENSEIEISNSIKKGKTYLFRKNLIKSNNTNKLEENKKIENISKNKIKSNNDKNKLNCLFADAAIGKAQLML